MSNDMYLPALSLIAKDFHIGINQIQLTITAFFAGSMAVQLIVGPLTDRYGRRPILLGGGLLFLLSTLGCSFAPSLAWLIAARFIQGIGVCTMMVAGYASIHDLYDDREAIHILVWMGTASFIAAAIGPVLGGLFILFTGWQGIFLSLFVLGFIALLGLWFIMPESTLAHNRQSLNIKTLLATYYKIFSNYSFIISSMSFALAYGGFIGWITASPFILMENLHLSPTQFGLLQFPIFGSYIIGAQLVKHLMEKIGTEKLIALGLTIAGVAGMLLLIFAFAIPHYSFSFAIPMMIYALGFGFMAAPLNRTTLTATTEQKGAAMAIFYLSMAVSGTLISLLLSIISETTFSSCLVIALAIALSFILNKVRK
jgi:DHA1 family multidrug/chloramphenicol efflux transport protein-like MFS transporter